MKPRGEQYATFLLGPHFPQLHAQVPEGISLGSSFLTSECSALPQFQLENSNVPVTQVQKMVRCLHSHEIVLRKPPCLPSAFPHRCRTQDPTLHEGAPCPPCSTKSPDTSPSAALGLRSDLRHRPFHLLCIQTSGLYPGSPPGFSL